MTTTPSFNSWVTCPEPNPEASLRLFCLPYAGGSSLIYRTWSANLPSTVEVCPIELPGRGKQMRLPALTRLEALVAAIAPMLLPYLDKPFVFFGHSMGALVSFELTHLLRREYNLHPLHLFLSARRPPQIPATKPPIHNLPEPAFKEELRRLNGTPPQVLENSELMQLLMPIVRADFAVLETYVYAPQPRLDCSITVFGGLQDKEVSFEQLQGWREQTNATFSIKMFDGDHFFVQSARSLLLESLSQELQQIQLSHAL
ncbi:thioesterase [Nostoc sp. CENA67]|uniref:Thioesterase n=1 Tax=Amazonocrinis nigriterrae CENA67 TaxID=2794033 RepID=A0A8J7HQ66_9NOST|nr:thioesterase II family protein [Amazonocrinis nigriterrae]MBH8561678.1 thioesterase [Amazonocrinis nigriterrae CENA67]